jgi:hypothetical protein
MSFDNTTLLQGEFRLCTPASLLFQKPLRSTGPLLALLVGGSTMNIKIIALASTVLAVSGAHAEMFTARATSVDGVGFTHNLLLGQIDGLAGHKIVIQTLGLGGDADVASGKQVFSAVGAGLNFTWGAGQEQNPPFQLNYVLDPTPQTSVNGRGFSYLNVDSQLTTPGVGQAVSIYWRGTADWDGRYTQDTDILGNVFNDSAVPASARAWIQYQYQPVPEPCALAGIAVGIAGLIRRRRR